MSSPVEQDGSASAEVLVLVGVAAGAAEVDQVKIHAVDLGPAEVRPAEVGLADLFGRFEMLLVEIVGVEAGSAALGCNRTVDQPAARGAHVERTLAHVRAAEIRPFPVDIGQGGAP